MSERLPRMNLHQRVQHALLVLLTASALGTGFGLERGLPPLGGLNHTMVSRLHTTLGLGILILLAYHVLYLTIRGYVESKGWTAFPLRLGAADRQALVDELRFLAGRAPTRPEADEYRLSQRIHFWWVLASLAAIASSGLAVGFWERFGTLAALGSLETLAALHRGCSLLLLATTLWHLYGMLVWEGRWDVVWSWATGRLSAEQALRRVPGAYRRFRLEEAERAEAAAAAAPEELIEARMQQEKDEVQVELEKGNQLALQEKYVEALFHYRRALERYPGYSQARYNMARVLARMGENEMAVEAYHQFLEGDPFHPLAQKAQEAIRDLSRSEQP